MSRSPQSPDRSWFIGAVVVMLGLAVILGWRLNQPWVTSSDFNGAVWSQAAHNNLRAGLSATRGLAAGFYFGPLPIPARGYYTHHPPGLPLVLTGLFAVAGEHEWVARLVPILASLGTAILVWWMVWSATGRARPATLVLAVLASLPMFLHYGQMVNHEPLALLAILGMLAGLHAWQTTGRPAGLTVLFVSLGFGLLMAWHVYLFAGLLAAWLLGRGPAPARRVGAWVLAVALLALLAFFLHIRLGRPDAWPELLAQFRWRLSLSSETSSISWGAWARRVAESLLGRIPWVAWVLAAFGGVALRQWRSSVPGWPWLGGVSLALAILSLIYVVAFRNASYIHAYAGYYLIVPVAILAGLELDLVWRFGEQRAQRAGASAGTHWQWPVAILAMVVMLTEIGVLQTWRLNHRVFPILTWHGTPREPERLIPDLGRAIRAAFSEDTEVLCNLLPVYGPHLPYYAQRIIQNNLTAPEHWQSCLADPGRRAGGVIWLGAPDGPAVVECLPAGTRTVTSIDGLEFCFWQP